QHAVAPQHADGERSVRLRSGECGRQQQDPNCDAHSPEYTRVLRGKEPSMTSDEGQAAAIKAQLHALAETYFDALRFKHPARVAPLPAEDVVIDSPMFATLLGRPAIEESYRQLNTIFPDIDQRLVSLLVDPPNFALTTRNIATQAGDFF